MRRIEVWDEWATAAADFFEGVVEFGGVMGAEGSRYFMKGCHSVPCLGARNSVTGAAFLSITVTKG